MATISAVLTGPTNDGLIVVVWETLTTTNRPGAGVLLARVPDKTVQVLGTFGASASIGIEGSNDDGTTWFSCHDITNTVITLSAAGGALIIENPKMMRPVLSNGDGSTDIDVYIVAVP